ncbi:MAG: DUF3887 domain-containing protein [Actinomycetota bacterium]
MKSNLLNISICILILVFVGAACSTFTKGKAAGEKAVENFHAQLNAEKFDEIYERSSKEFKVSDSKENIIKFFQTVHKKLGTVNKSSSQGWHVNTTPTGTVITMNYETEFSNDTATESFVFYMDGEQAQLVNYKIDSKKLITE